LAFSNFISDLKLETTKHVSWFDLKDSFSEYGVKTVGLLCEEIVASGKVAQDRYLAGFQQIPPVIPGLGPVDLKETKLSMRVGVDLARKIEAGAMPSLTQTLPSAAYSLGGLVDACHPTAAAVVVSIGQEATLIEKLEAEIALQISKIDS
ncbi:MAG: hypothetical protein KDD53_09660, partial [Bdellovibrionales bacterium]|nr:hypothetical protein [Bdellovibrionales bacterium]